MAVDSFQLFDSHFHVIDRRFPLVANGGYLPKEFTCEDYLNRMKGHHLLGGAVVSGSFQGFDQTYLIESLKTLGASFVGVVQVPVSISDDDVIALHRAGVRAVRFNLRRGGSEDVKHLDSLARRVFELAGWHVELYVASEHLDALSGTLVSLPAVSIDHLGLHKRGFANLLKLVEKGVYVKATGFGRVDFDVKEALKNLYSAGPDNLVFGTDLPSTRAPRPYLDSDVLLVVEALGETHSRQVFYDNAVKLYCPPRL